MLANLYRAAIIFGVVSAVSAYAFNFDKFSETELTQVAYIWVPLIAFGIGGYVNRKKGGPKSIVAAVGFAAIAAGALFIFLEAIFPGL